MEWTKIDFNDLPKGEVLAGNFNSKTFAYKGKLLGYLNKYGECIDRDTILSDCTHYIDIHKYDLNISNDDL